MKPPSLQPLHVFIHVYKNQNNKNKIEISTRHLNLHSVMFGFWTFRTSIPMIFELAFCKPSYFSLSLYSCKSVTLSPNYYFVYRTNRGLQRVWVGIRLHQSASLDPPPWRTPLLFLKSGPDGRYGIPPPPYFSLFQNKGGPWIWVDGQRNYRRRRARRRNHHVFDKYLLSDSYSLMMCGRGSGQKWWE